MQDSVYLISAIGTPLEDHERLCHEGLDRQLSDHWTAGIDGILVAGSMGMMQMLRDETYRDLVRRATELSHGKGEVLVGVGDTGWARTCDRIEWVSRYPIDGVVVLPPYLFRFTQDQLIDYFLSLADVAPVPLYLYDVPALTQVAIDIATYEALAKHPNIRGAKVSGRIDIAREIVRRLGDEFRVIVAEPDKVDTLFREGFVGHLDGMFAIAPPWIVAIASAARDGDWDRAATYQAKLNELRDLLIASGNVFGAFSVMMNAQGIPGNFHAAPFPRLDESQRQAILSARIMRELVAPSRKAGEALV